ncbi:MAG: restriction endonuclease subunit S [Acidobacteria bacterium]|nr:restriction endonuclease subunit S [Acidobacteriota bacterium]
MLAEREQPLPQGWSAIRLGEYTEESKARAGTNHQLPVLSVTKHRGIVRSEDFFKKAVYSRDTSNYKVVRPGQFAYATIHLNEGSIGKLKVRTPGVVSPMYTVFDVNTDVDSDYLLAVLKSQQSLTVYERITQGTVSRRGGIAFRTLSDLVLHHPPLGEQRKISAILSSVDEAIEKTQAVINQVLVVKRGLAQELLTRGIPGRHTHFQQTEIGEIPADWDFRLLGALATPDRGLQTGPFGSQLHKADYSPRGVPVLMPKDMMDGRVSDSNSARVPEAKAEELSRHRVKAGDLLFARRGEIGRVGLVTACEKGWLCGTGCLRFRPKDPTVSPYLRYWTSWSKSVRWLNEHAVGQTMLNLNTSILGRLPVALPSESERSDIVELLEALEKRVTTLEASVVGFRRVKSALMSVLLTGELRVTPDSEPE